MNTQEIFDLSYRVIGICFFVLVTHLPAYLFLRMPHKVLHYMARFNHSMWIQSGSPGKFPFEAELDPERTAEYKGVETLQIVGIISLFSAIIVDWMILSRILELISDRLGS